MELKVAIAGLGAIGKVVAARILKGISGLTVTAIATRRETQHWPSSRNIVLNAMSGFCRLRTCQL